jgi:hypothetical protein
VLEKLLEREAFGAPPDPATAGFIVEPARPAAVGAITLSQVAVDFFLSLAIDMTANHHARVGGAFGQMDFNAQAGIAVRLLGDMKKLVVGPQVNLTTDNGGLAIRIRISSASQIGAVEERRVATVHERDKTVLARFGDHRFGQRLWWGSH